MVKNINMLVRIAGILMTAAVIGCGSAKVSSTVADGNGKLDQDGKLIVSTQARNDFDKIAVEYKAADSAGWNDDNCKQVIKHFQSIADEYKLADAAYNVGVVHLECGDVDIAAGIFKDVLNQYKDRVDIKQLCLTHLAVMDINDDKIADAQVKLKDVIVAGRNTMEAVPAYTLAATINREKAVAGDQANWGKAQKLLRTALAIDAKYMPALYQLTMFYFELALSIKKPSLLTLASLVFDQAVKTDPEFAPIYHALGRIYLQKKELVEALKAFEAAFKKDSTLFEAYMSFAAINLSFRGYEEARGAFEKAIILNPDNYDAHMGLGVAARGLGDYVLARAEYKKAAELNPARTGYIFNVGLLEMDYENDGTPDGYEKAKKVFEKFLQKYVKGIHDVDPDGKGPELSWVAKAEKRVKSCTDAAKQIREALKEMEELEKMAKEQAKQAKAMEEQQKQAAALAEKEAAGEKTSADSGEAVDEAAIEAEIAAEEKAEIAKSAEEKKVAEEAEKVAEEKAAEDKKAADEADKADKAKQEKAKVDLD